MQLFSKQSKLVVLGGKQHHENNKGSYSRSGIRHKGLTRYKKLSEGNVPHRGQAYDPIYS